MSKGCCFTGHRQIEYDEIDRLQMILPAEVRELVAEGYIDFYAGGAMGFDTYAALAVLQVRDSGEDIKLHLLLPGEGQERAWSLQMKHVYHDIRERADSYEYLSETCSPAAMLKRNRELVERSELCICYLASERGGTAYTVKEAKKRGIEVRNLFPETQRSFEGF